jgi:hypothetical protein
MARKGQRTSGGVELTDEQLDAIVEEAERGYGAEQLRPRARPGRPSLGAEAATVFHVRLPGALREGLLRAADAEQTTPSDVVRRALAEYLARGATKGRQASA